LVAAKGCNNGGLIGEDDLVVGAGREETLEKGNGRVEDDGALSASLDADLHFVVVNEIRADALDVGGGTAVEIGRSEVRTEGVGLDLTQK